MSANRIVRNIFVLYFAQPGNCEVRSKKSNNKSYGIEITPFSCFIFLTFSDFEQCVV